MSGADPRIAAIVAANMATLDRRGPVTPRAQHGKGHGIVAASFTVRGDIPEALRVGVFAEPRRWDALIRFSNGARDDDRRPDAHGMAIKLAEAGQDFVLVDHPTFFTGDIDEYAAFNTAFAAIIAYRLGKGSVLGVLRAMAILAPRPALARRLRAFASQTPRSPLLSRYFSSVPYALGDTPVHYEARPPAVSAAGVTDRDGLSLALRFALSRGPATFTFGVRTQADSRRHPVEDPTIDWSARGAPFVALADIDIPAQRVGGDDGLMVFSPWTAQAAHQPLGAINAVRAEVYRAMAAERLRRNEAPRAAA